MPVLILISDPDRDPPLRDGVVQIRVYDQVPSGFRSTSRWYLVPAVILAGLVADHYHVIEHASRGPGLHQFDLSQPSGFVAEIKDVKIANDLGRHTAVPLCGYVSPAFMAERSELKGVRM
jgi:hypothetical protein